MTYEEITAVLPYDMLDSLAMLEARELASIRDRAPSEIAVLRELDRARDYYVHDITEWLDHPAVLTPDAILSHRRAAYAWAIAELIRAQRRAQPASSCACGNGEACNDCNLPPH